MSLGCHHSRLIVMIHVLGTFHGASDIDTFWLCQELKKSQCAFIHWFGPNLSRALKLHLSLSGQSQVGPRSVSGQSQVSLRSVSGQSQVSPRSVSGQSQVSLRPVPGQSQVSLRSVLGLSELTSSVRRSLKYFVL